MSSVSDVINLMNRAMAPFRGVIWDTRTDWSDVVAMKGAREILRGVSYPDDDTRRSLYASWLRVFASDVWQDSFDHLMLECVAATPSPSIPETPLFADIFKAHDPVDRLFFGVVSPVLNPENLPRMFSLEPRPAELLLPSRPGFVDFVADLLRRSRDSREALNEAGLIIGFCCLALATVVAKPADLLEFFRTRMKSALSEAVPTSFDGDVHCPGERFIAELIRKAHSADNKVKPYIVLLVLGQYCFLDDAKGTAPSADVKFLEKGFLEHAKFGQLAVIELLYKAQEETGIKAPVLNQKLQAADIVSRPKVSLSSERVEFYLKGVEEPMQRTRPWSRAANRHFFMNLNLDMNLPYAMMLTGLLTSDPTHQLWQRAEFIRVPEECKDMLRRWAVKFRVQLCQGVAEEEPDKRDPKRDHRNSV